MAQPSAALEDAETSEPLTRLASAPITEGRRGGPHVIDIVRGARRAIEAAYRRLRDAGGEAIESPAAEWLLDNYYLVERAARVVRDEFPPAFERRLRRLTTGAPLVLALARGFVAVGSGHVDGDGIRRLTVEFQTRRRLSIAELWALPIMLRVALLERLGVVAASIAPAGTVRPLHSGAADEVVSNCVRSLRALDTTDWKAFFEELSATEDILRRDPAAMYARMDFATRDRYRKVVEDLAVQSRRTEEEIAEETVRAAEKNRDGRAGHVGFHLVGSGAAAFARTLGARAPWRARWRRFLRRYPASVYLGAIGALIALHEVLLLAALHALGAGAALGATAALLGLVPAATIAVTLVNTLVTRLLPPGVLPKMDFSKGIPPECRTLVIMPALLGGIEDVRPLLSRIELHWLANADANIHLALLTDLADAAAEALPQDDELVRRTEEGVRALNDRYGEGDAGPFHLLHRPRRWNAAEGCWMGWERKRGKLVELNRLLSGDNGTDLSHRVGDAEILRTIRFVITLDEDTELPRDAARRLVGTFAHPLNRPEFDERTGRVVAGYTVLQPRIEVTPLSADASWFAHVFAGDGNLDLYGRAVSEAYQDLFDEGIYVGKGIYDPAAFEKSLRERIPENALLSHDLFEGVHGRAGFVSEVVLLEAYPPDYLTHARRLHRWARGDWQLLPWLGRRVPLEGGGHGPNPLSLVARWKIVDNLRRTLLAPTLLGFLLVAWIALPGSSIAWTAIALLALAAPALTETADGLLSTRIFVAPSRTFGSVMTRARRSIALWALRAVFLAYRSIVMSDSILRTVFRLVVSRRRLLQWTSAAATARVLGDRTSRRRFWREMMAAPLLAVAAAILLMILRAAALPVALPLLLAWLASPEIARRASQPRRPKTERLVDEDMRHLRVLARRTWGFFDTFVGPADQWLPPDHFQETPRGEVAHRTSPTNIGLLELATLAAHDLGYAGLLSVELRLKNTLDTLAQMERYRGHFYNWYDTRDLEPLPPRYISTVDSGNLAGCLVVVKQGCRELASGSVMAPRRWDGLVDTVDVLAEVIAQATRRYGAARFASLARCVDSVRREAMVLKTQPSAWGAGVVRLLEHGCPAVERALLAAIADVDPELLSELRIWSAQVREHVHAMHRDEEVLLPWEVALASPPALFTRPDVSEALSMAWGSFTGAIPRELALRDLPSACERIAAGLSPVEEALRALPDRDVTAIDARTWTGHLAQALTRARSAGQSILDTFVALGRQADDLFHEMDFSWLYDERRHLFHIGYNVTTDSPDEHHYDLLASEARLASFLAIAKGEVPEEHWLHLGRPFGRFDGSRVLLSWSGTMFEYLMPSLFVREGEDSLAGRACRAAIEAQIAYGRQHGVPWGVSEAGYYQFDAQQNYQYRAFGVPDLGFKRGLEDDLVIAPYACVLALPFVPRAALANLRRLEALGLGGRYGFYEAADCTRSRLPSGADRAVVRSFMAHHQGMILAALDNVLHDRVVARRFEAEPVVQTAQPLLFERPAEIAPVERARLTLEQRPVTARRARAGSWHIPRDAAFPHAHVLSNGRYHTIVTETGGASRWKNLALTRWEADPTLGDHGFRLYVRDVDTDDVWSSTSGGADVLFHAHMAEIHHRFGTISLTERVCVAPEDDVEIRHVTVTNEGDVRRRVEITSYAEVVLGDAAEDGRHPTFSKLFVESEYVAELHALLFHRRPRSGRESGWLLHMMVPGNRRAAPTAFESSRERFLGRRRDARHPAALRERDPRTPGTAGATLDPVMALSGAFELSPHRRASLAYILTAADSREDAVALARRYRSLHALEWCFELAQRAAETEIADLGLDPRDLPVAQQLLSLLLYPHGALRAPEEILGRNRRGQADLWRYSISGDLPILLVRIHELENTPLLLLVLRAHQLWRRRGVAADVVLVAEHGGGYGEDVEDRIVRAIARVGGETWRDRPGGLFVLRAAHMPEAERTLLLAAARVVIDASTTDLAGDLARVAAEPARLPPLVPTLPDSASPEPLERPEGLLFDNGLGGFTPDGREYVVHLGPADATPAPWVNVIANPGFGFVVSESGGGFTWAEHSAENRLTPWRNDPVRDEPGEALYLRDEETGAVWSPTPLPAPGPGSYEIRHGAGYTTFRHRCRGLDQQLGMFVPVEDAVKIVQLQVTNRLERPRRVTVTYYVEWVLGAMRDASQAFVIPEFAPASQALLARNPWSAEFGDRVAFAAASEKLHGLTADRTEFLGRHGSREFPAALGRIGLASTVRPGLDPCAALQVHLDLAPGATAEVHFLLGQARSREEAVALIAKYRDRANVEVARVAVTRHWDSLLGTIQVRTPEPALDLMLNRWLLYQTLASRVWARAGFYQPGGAFGFRDQLQDVTALFHAGPALCRAHILEAARHQFEAGDVLHWWHPHSGAGVRTRCSDDLLWLPFVTAHYVTATGDETILREEVEFLKGEPLRPEQAARYERFPFTEQRATLYRHCVAAIERGRTAGVHGLPLFGSGDWNDGMDRVGIEGRGESVWLGWFLYATLTRFAPLCERMGEGTRADELRRHADRLRQALEASAWDGAWYRRGYYDDGRPLGSAGNVECRIDSLSQSWAVLASAADERRTAAAMNAARRHLVRGEDDLILLLTPAFDGGTEDPGYIKAYPPGVRENGGQYTHAAIWFLWALAALGDADGAVALFQKLLPLHHARTRGAAERYRVEPYVLAADIYGAPPWTGRGGWTWYTGAAGWAYRFGIEMLLGVRLEQGAWRIDPCIPRQWPGFEVTLRDGTTSFRIRVTNPRGVGRGVTAAQLDGASLAQPILPRLQDGRTHEVQMTIG